MISNLLVCFSKDPSLHGHVTASRRGLRSRALGLSGEANIFSFEGRVGNRRNRTIQDPADICKHLFHIADFMSHATWSPLHEVLKRILFYLVLAYWHTSWSSHVVNCLNINILQHSPQILLKAGTSTQSFLQVIGVEWLLWIRDLLFQWLLGGGCLWFFAKEPMIKHEKAKEFRRSSHFRSWLICTCWPSTLQGFWMSLLLDIFLGTSLKCSNDLSKFRSVFVCSVCINSSETLLCMLAY